MTLKKEETIFFKFVLRSQTLKWLARKLRTDSDSLRNIVDVLLKERQGQTTLSPSYTILVKRKTGGKRQIHVPSTELKKIQRKIDQFILCYLPISPNAFGFSGGGIEKALKPHLAARAIWTCDIKGAFPSTFEERVFSALKSTFSPSAARLLTLLTTTPNGHRLPQGAPTSPKLFDICMFHLDKEFSILAEGYGGKFTRYADNLFFSGSVKNIPAIEKEVLALFRMAELTPHRIRTMRLSKPQAFAALGLNIIERKIHNRRKFKRSLRKSISHVKWLLERGNDCAVAWLKLKGQMKGFARTDTLSPKLLEEYSALEQRLS